MTATQIQAPPLQPGRSCPLHYRYGAAALNVPAQSQCDTLYVVGGLYGNPQALATVLELFEREPAPRKRLVFNGDFHWFDTDPEVFARIQQQVLSFDAIRGNVETELSDDSAGDGDSQAGCGCGYPDWVDDAVVDHSNQILQRLRQTALTIQSSRQPLAALPMWRRIDVGGQRVAIVHGDADSLAGWGFAQERCREPGHQAQLAAWFEAAQVDVFASSHTCLPVFLPLAAGTVLNNGAAGMPNFTGDTAGLLTRIATTAYLGGERRFGLQRHGLHLDAIGIAHDAPAWHELFLRQWPPGSAAHRSYWPRIQRGPAYSVAEAMPGTMTILPVT